ncbi:CBS domain-containing protein [Kitasatospora sp. NBC_01287]|uniref:CBS domain-containing protein n=1 Tax=Kitasatospora sp. NBC_01287 TaxID=2903573 RepID=UPI00224E83D7|nr:CBS domain-containing protein [Kitasatospora sp. NBC_01287]MCX4744774.1 CBS domain-containing protein [Kitasatospora sp. NBC_01287]
MKHPHVSDVMTHTVIAVGRDAPFQEIVENMRKWRISALPVLAGDRHVVGVVSEADLLAREELREAVLPPSDRATDATRQQQAQAVTAGQLMSFPAITVHPDATTARAARAMVHARVKRLPVIDSEGHLVGVVSRGDLLKVYLRPDDDIAGDVHRALLAHPLPADASGINVEVEEGRVTLRGTVPEPSPIGVLDLLARSVPGVVDVRTLISVGPTAQADDGRSATTRGSGATQ